MERYASRLPFQSLCKHFRLSVSSLQTACAMFGEIFNEQKFSGRAHQRDEFWAMNPGKCSFKLPEHYTLL